MALLDDIRKAVRVSPEPVADPEGRGPEDEGWEPTYTSEFDDELQDLIDGALADMLRAGVRPALLDADSPDKLVKLGVKAYAKAHFGYDNPERGDFAGTYERILVDLKNATWSNVEYWRTDMGACGAAEIEPQPYTGRSVRPEVAVDIEGEPLVPGRDYRVSYVDNVEVGTATALVHGTGEYAGTIAVEFEIAEPQEGGEGE